MASYYAIMINMRTKILVFFIVSFLLGGCLPSAHSTISPQSEQTGRSISALGDGMEPTIIANSQISVRDLSNHEREKLSRGEIVVYHFPRNAFTSEEEFSLYKNIDHLGRLIALQGDTVEIKNNKVYLNNELLAEPYLLKQNATKTFSVSKWVLKENETFILGDNRDNSVDSRAVGPIMNSMIFSVVKK